MAADDPSPADLLGSAESTRIADLTPELSNPQSRSVSGVITITWPYSHVTNSIAFILAEKDFRLRREKGQVRVEFHGAAGKAIAESGIGGGDEIRVSLDGVRWEPHQAKMPLPGTPLEWQLKFVSHLILSFRRADAQAGDVEEFVKVNSTDEEVVEELSIPEAVAVAPASISPVETSSPAYTPPAFSRAVPASLPTKRDASSTFESDEYASPAFVKRARVSYGSLFEGGLDIFGDEDGSKMKNKKKRPSRFSMGRSQWKYSSRSPSPVAEFESQDELEIAEELDSHEVGEALAEASVILTESPSRSFLRDEAIQTQDATFSRPAGTQVPPEAHPVNGTTASSLSQVEKDHEKPPLPLSTHNEQITEPAELSVPSFDADGVTGVPTTQREHGPHTNIFGSHLETQHDNSATNATSFFGAPSDFGATASHLHDNNLARVEHPFATFGGHGFGANHARVDHHIDPSLQFGHPTEAHPATLHADVDHSSQDIPQTLYDTAQTHHIPWSQPVHENPFATQAHMTHDTMHHPIPEHAGRFPSPAPATFQSQVDQIDQQITVDETSSSQPGLADPDVDAEHDHHADGGIENHKEGFAAFQDRQMRLEKQSAFLQHATEREQIVDRLAKGAAAANVQNGQDRIHSSEAEEDDVSGEEEPDEEHYDEDEEEEGSEQYEEGYDQENAYAESGEDGGTDHDIEEDEEEEEEDYDEEDEDEDSAPARTAPAPSSQPVFISLLSDSEDEGEDAEDSAAPEEPSSQPSRGPSQLDRFDDVAEEEEEGSEGEDEDAEGSEAEESGADGDEVEEGALSEDEEMAEPEPVEAQPDDVSEHEASQPSDAEEAADVEEEPATISSQPQHHEEDTRYLEEEEEKSSTLVDAKTSHIPVPTEPNVAEDVEEVEAEDTPMMDENDETADGKALDEDGEPETIETATVGRTPFATQVEAEEQSSASAITETLRVSQHGQDGSHVSMTQSTIIAPTWTEPSQAAVSSPPLEAEDTPPTTAADEPEATMDSVVSQPTTEQPTEPVQEKVETTRRYNLRDAPTDAVDEEPEKAASPPPPTDAQEEAEAIGDAEVIAEAEPASRGDVVSDPEKHVEQLPTPMETQGIEDAEDARASGEAEAAVEAKVETERRQSDKPEDEVDPDQQLMAEYLEYSQTKSDAEQDNAEGTPKDNSQETTAAEEAAPVEFPADQPAAVDEKVKTDEKKDVRIRVRSLRNRGHRKTPSNESAELASTDPSIALAKAPSTTRSGRQIKEPAAPPKIRVTRRKKDQADPSLALAKGSPTTAQAPERKVTPEPASTPKKTRTSSQSLRRSHTPEAAASTEQNLSKSSPASVAKSPSIASTIGPEDDRVSGVKIELLHNLRTDLPDYLSFALLRSSMGKTADFMAIATMEPSRPYRPKNGPRDYMLELTLTDPSVAPSGVSVAQIYRPHQASLPAVHAGDVVLLREFQVLSLKGRGFGIRASDASAWAVFEKGDEEMLPQIKGPPVEVSEAEYSYAEGLRRWWALLDDKAMKRVARATKKASRAAENEE